VLDGDPALPVKKGAEHPVFGPCLLWPNDWIYQDQDGTWRGGGTRSRPHCARRGPISTPQKGGRAYVYCSQTAGWIRVPLGTEVGLSPGDIVLDGDPTSPFLKGHSPQFSAISVVAKRLDGLRCHLVWR